MLHIISIKTVDICTNTNHLTLENCHRGEGGLGLLPLH